MSEKETDPPENVPAEAAADVAPAIKSLAECCELNQAGVDVTEDIGQCHSHRAIETPKRARWGTEVRALLHTTTETLV